MPKVLSTPSLGFNRNQHAQGLVGVRQHFGFAYGEGMRGCHQARGRAGYGSKKNFAILHETIYSWMGLFIGVAPSIVLRYRANEGRTSVCEMDAVPTGVGID